MSIYGGKRDHCNLSILKNLGNRCKCLLRHFDRYKLCNIFQQIPFQIEYNLFIYEASRGGSDQVIKYWEISFYHNCTVQSLRDTRTSESSNSLR